MISVILTILSIVGSLGVFLFGMKLMSEALQKVAGFRMRSILAAITSNRFKSITTGLVVTAIIQSSSATTVMIVSFVNAGLLSLVESVGMIMGANIGTTLKAWIFAWVGVNIKASQFALPVVAIFFPFLFSKNGIRKYWGEFAMGLAFIFFGLDLLYSILPDLTSNAVFTTFLLHINGFGAGSVLIFVIIGMVIAALFQSSSAAMVFTLAFSSMGLINFPLAAAMVIGENIGTTVTANLAAIIANEQAKKAARAHFLIKLIGAVWVLSIFPFFLKFIDWFMISIFNSSAYTNPKIIPWALSAIHTLFNIINTLLLVWFIPLLIKLSGKLVNRTLVQEERFRLPFISKTIFSTSEISLLQAKKELIMYSKRVKNMYKTVKLMFNQVNQDEFDFSFNQIVSFETICDQMEIEISSYLTRMGQGELSLQSNEQLKVMLRITNNLESIADNCYNIAKTFNRKRIAKIWFTQDIRDNINDMLILIDEAIDIMHENLDMEFSKVTLEKAEKCENKIDLLRNNLKEEYSANKERGYKYEAGVIYNDIFTRCERLGDHIFNVTEAIVASNKSVK
jgi:phosphate:Na+ symporter